VSDELVWHCIGRDNWRAATDSGTYQVFMVTDWGSPRTFGVLLSDDGLERELYVGGGSLESVKLLLEKHHSASCRARRWADFMRDNEPPTKEDQ
jgi:L-fucose isomerase-like protein